MTTYDYELLDPPADKIADAIQATPALARLLPDDVLNAMLGWSQMTQGVGASGVYEACHEALHVSNVDTSSCAPVHAREKAPAGYPAISDRR